jgi:hypothetical protein
MDIFTELSTIDATRGVGSTVPNAATEPDFLTFTSMLSAMLTTATESKLGAFNPGTESELGALGPRTESDAGALIPSSTELEVGGKTTLSLDNKRSRYQHITTMHLNLAEKQKL